MRYTVEVTLPANTSRTLPVSSAVNVAPGVLTQVAIQFPPGSAGLAGARVTRWGRQIVPATTDAWLIGDDEIHTLPESLDVLTSPYELTCVAYNDDDLFAHVVIFHLDVVPTAASTTGAVGSVVGMLRGALGI